jgi:hypothetical protein
VRLFQPIWFVRFNDISGDIYYSKWSIYSLIYYTGTVDGWGFECTELSQDDHSVMVF